MLHSLTPNLMTWAEIHGVSRNQPYPWNSYLVHIENRNVRVLIDPLTLSTEQIQQIEEIGPPTHILLTCHYHERDSEQFRKKWGCRLLVHENQADLFKIDVDDTFSDRAVLWDLMEVIRVPDVRHREEVSFLLQDEGALIVGDLVSGGRKDRGIPDGQVGIYAPQYLVDIEKARASLRILMDLEFDLLCFGHGSPLLNRAKQVLRQYIENDSIWKNLECEREEELRLNPNLRELHGT